MLNTHSLQKKSFGILRISFVIVAVAISFFLIKSFETRAQDTETVTTTVQQLQLLSVLMLSLEQLQLIVMQKVTIY